MATADAGCELTSKLLRKAIRRIIRHGDLATLTNKAVRAELERQFQVPLKERKEEINQLVLQAAEQAQEQPEQAQEQPEESKPRKAHAVKENTGQQSPNELRPAPTAEDVEEEARLRDLIRQANLTSKTRFKGVAMLPKSQVIDRLRGVLIDALGSSHPTRKQIAAFNAERERAAELDGIDITNVIKTAGRPRRSAAEPQSLVTSSKEGAHDHDGPDPKKRRVPKSIYVDEEEDSDD